MYVRRGGEGQHIGVGAFLICIPTPPARQGSTLKAAVETEARARPGPVEPPRPLIGSPSLPHKLWWEAVEPCGLAFQWAAACSAAARKAVH